MAAGARPPHETTAGRETSPTEQPAFYICKLGFVNTHANPLKTSEKDAANAQNTRKFNTVLHAPCYIATLPIIYNWKHAAWLYKCKFYICKGKDKGEGKGRGGKGRKDTRGRAGRSTRTPARQPPMVGGRRGKRHARTLGDFRPFPQCNDLPFPSPLSFSQKETRAQPERRTRATRGKPASNTTQTRELPEANPQVTRGKPASNPTQARK